MEEAKTTFDNILDTFKKKKERNDFYIPDNKSNQNHIINNFIE